MAGCGTSEAPESAEISVTAITEVVIVSETPTPIPSTATLELTTLVAPDPTVVVSGQTPQEAVIAANVEEADAEAGEALYSGALLPACTTCHIMDESQRQVAPNLANFSEIAATRIEGQDAFTYAYNSIRYADQHTVEGYAEGLMPSYDGVLSDQEVYDLIAYLWTLSE